MNLSPSRRFLRNPLTVLAILAAINLPPTALAQNWIAGASVGVAEQQDYTVGAPIPNRDDTDTAYRVFGGYLIGEHQRVIASFIDLGTVRYSGPAFGGFNDSSVADGFDVSYVVGWSPGEQERISIFGTVGVFAWDQEVTTSDASGTFDYRDEGTSFSVGLGAEFRLGSGGRSPWAVELAYQLLKDVGDTKILETGDIVDHEFDREVFSAGVSYRFGRNE